jgi:hypothetical protein
MSKFWRDQAQSHYTKGVTLLAQINRTPRPVVGGADRAQLLVAKALAHFKAAEVALQMGNAGAGEISGDSRD